MAWFQNNFEIALIFILVFYFLGNNLVKHHPSKWLRLLSIIIFSSSSIVSLTLIYKMSNELFTGFGTSDFIKGDWTTFSNLDNDSLLSSFQKYLREETKYRFFVKYPILIFISLGYVGVTSILSIIESVSILTDPSLKDKDRRDRSKFLKRIEAITQKRKEKKQMINNLLKRIPFLKEDSEEGWLIDKDDKWCKRFFLEKDTNSKSEKNIVEQTGKVYLEGKYKITKEIKITIEEAKSDWKYYLENDWQPTKKRWD